jgi:hypothetical protein
VATQDSPVRARYASGAGSPAVKLIVMSQKNTRAARLDEQRGDIRSL